VASFSSLTSKDFVHHVLPHGVLDAETVASAAEDIRKAETKRAEAAQAPPALLSPLDNDWDIAIAEALENEQAEGKQTQPHRSPKLADASYVAGVSLGLNQARELLHSQPSPMPHAPVMPLTKCALLRAGNAHAGEAAAGEPRLGPGYYQVSMPL